MKRLLTALILAGILLPAPANADPCNNPYTCKTPPWNGQLQPAWEVPYGGFNGGPTQCDVFTLQCRGVVSNPNG